MENSYSYIGYANFSDGSDPANSNSGRNAWVKLKPAASKGS